MDCHAASDDHYVLVSERSKSVTEIEMVFNGSVVEQADCLLVLLMDRSRTLYDWYRKWVVFRVECDFERYPDSMV